MRLISNSEVSSYLGCERRYTFEYVHDLEPKVYSGPISKGIFIHKILEEFYIAQSEGLSLDECISAATQVIVDAMSSNEISTEDALATRELMQGYFSLYGEDDFEKYEIIAVESKFSSALTDKFGMPGTIDLLWKEVSTGVHWIVDHKTSYNFFSDEQLSMSVQFPKYVYLLRDAGFNVAGVMVNQIRTRSLKNGDLYKRAWVKPSDHVIREAMDQHIRASERIIQFRESNAKPIPNYNKLACGYCSFVNLCDSIINGAPIEYQIAQDFQKRTGYGYNFTPKEATSD